MIVVLLTCTRCYGNGCSYPVLSVLPEPNHKRRRSVKQPLSTPACKTRLGILSVIKCGQFHRSHVTTSTGDYSLRLVKKESVFN